MIVTIRQTIDRIKIYQKYPELDLINRDYQIHGKVFYSSLFDFAARPEQSLAKSVLFAYDGEDIENMPCTNKEFSDIKRMYNLLREMDKRYKEQSRSRNITNKVRECTKYFRMAMVVGLCEKDKNAKETIFNRFTDKCAEIQKSMSDAEINTCSKIFSPVLNR